MPSAFELRPRQDRSGALRDVVRPARGRLASRLHVVAHRPTDDESDTQRSYARYRGAMPGIAIVCPAENLQAAETARWVRRHGVTVAAYTSSELALAISVGIRPARLVMHGDRGQWGPIRCAVEASVRQFVVDSCEQLPVLEHYARRCQQVLIDVGTAHVHAAIAAVCASDRLDLVGLHCRMDPQLTAPHRYSAAIHATIDEMARIRQDRGIITSRLSLAGPLGLAPEAIVAVIEEAIDDGCARWSFPRPAVALTPH